MDMFGTCIYNERGYDFNHLQKTHARIDRFNNNTTSIRRQPSSKSFQYEEGSVLSSPCGPSDQALLYNFPICLWFVVSIREYMFLSTLKSSHMSNLRAYVEKVLMSNESECKSKADRSLKS